MRSRHPAVCLSECVSATYRVFGEVLCFYNLVVDLKGLAREATPRLSAFGD